MENPEDIFDESLRVETSALRDVFRTQLPPRRIRVVASALEIERIQAIELTDITTAFSVHENGRARVIVLHGWLGKCVVHVRSREEAERFLRAIRFSNTQRNASFRIIAKIQLMVGVMIAYAVAGATVVSHRNGYFWTLAPAVFGAFFLLARSGRNLLVGRDGITISRFGWRRFISYREIESVSPYVGTTRRKNLSRVDTFFGVALRLRNKEELPLPIATKTSLGPLDDRVAGALERIDRNLTAWRASQPIDSALLERDGRPMQRWIDSVRKLGGTAETTYRVAATPFDRESLFVIAEGPANKASSRGAAAVALGVRLDDEVRTRLRVACATVVDPNLRSAFEHVIQGKPEGDLEGVLQKLDPVQQV